MPFRIGSLGRITLDIDPSFLVLIGLFVFSDQEQWGFERAILWAPVLILSVLIHELAHALTIQAFGYGGSRIVLLSTGGVTINQRYAKPWQELVISLAGPVSSFVIVGVAWFVFQTQPSFFLSILLISNIYWGLLNLLPVAPLDGGHALLHLLRTFLAPRTALNLSVWIGMIVGVLVAIWAVRNDRLLLAVIIAFYAFRNFQTWRMANPVPDVMK